jgi:hypothetical protein
MPTGRRMSRDQDNYPVSYTTSHPNHPNWDKTNLKLHLETNYCYAKRKFKLIKSQRRHTHNSLSPMCLWWKIWNMTFDHKSSFSYLMKWNGDRQTISSWTWKSCVLDFLWILLRLLRLLRFIVHHKFCATGCQPLWYFPTFFDSSNIRSFLKVATEQQRSQIKCACWRVQVPIILCVCWPAFLGARSPSLVPDHHILCLKWWWVKYYTKSSFG